MKKIYFTSVAVFITAFQFANAQSNCVPGTAQTDLDIGNVRARMLTDGDMWWDPTQGIAQYEVPKGSGKHSMFAGAIWIGGLDPGNNMKTACQTYRQTGSDFWPGPLDTTCLPYDYHWNLNKSDVVDFVNNGTTTVQDIINYPGNGPFGTPLAPYFDANGDGTYNYLDGDYPYFNLASGTASCCDMLHGDQCLWWVFNDMGNIHTETGSPPLGIEIQCQAFAFDMSHYQTINTTFYQYTLINKSATIYSDTYFGQFIDADLGYYLDDYVGCDVGKGLGYCYNGDPTDDLPAGYGTTPPAIGVDIFHGPLADPGDGIDNNHNGTVDEANEDVTMSKFIYFNNNADPVTGNPNGAFEYYNYLQGLWRNGTPMTYGGNGYNPGSTDYCNYVYPGLTDTSHTINWTEPSVGNPADDRRFLISAGPFTMLPGQVNCITMGAIWARAATGDNLASIPLMLSSDSIMQIIFDSCFTNFTVGINLPQQDMITGISPNPFSDKTTISFNNPSGESYTLKLYDVHGALLRTISKIKSNSVIVEKGNLKSEMYIFKLEGEKGKINSGKLVLSARQQFE